MVPPTDLPRFPGLTWGFPNMPGTCGSRRSPTVGRAARGSVLAAIALGLLESAAPGAAAASTQRIEILQATVHPGDLVRMAFVTADPALVSVDVLPRVHCTITSPGGAVASVCADPEGVLHVGVVASGEAAYLFSYRVPDVLGTYRVHVDVDPGLLRVTVLLDGILWDRVGVAGATPSADRAFVVQEAPPPGTGGGGAGDPPPGSDQPGPGPAPGADVSHDGPSSGHRPPPNWFLVTAATGGASLAAVLLARRFAAGA